MFFFVACVYSSAPTALIEYHVCHYLSTTFWYFLFFFTSLCLFSQKQESSMMWTEKEGFEPSRRLPDLPHFECGPFNRLGTSPNLCYIPGPDPPTNSAGGNREEQQDRTSNIIQFELGWNPHGSKGFSRLALRIGNLISNHYTNLDDDGKSGTIAVTTEPQNIPLKVAVRWLLSL